MTVLAAVMTGPGAPLELRELPDPHPGQGEVVLDTVASEVCGTDVHLWHGRLAGVPYPIIPGHVSVGRIRDLRGVERDALGRPLAPGDLVTFLDVHGTCHACEQCTVARQPNRCPHRRVYGISLPVEGGPFGGWAEAIRLLPGVRILRLPDGVPADRLIGGGCGLFTGFAAVERSHLRMGDTVLVQGTGPVGLSAVAFARLRGAARVWAIGDPASRLELARELGASRTFSLTGTSLQERLEAVREATGGRGVDVVVEAAGQPEAVAEGLDLLRDGGRYVVAGHYTDTGPVSLNPHLQINRKHAEVVGQWGTDFHHLVGALRMLEREGDRLPFERVIGARYGLDRVEEALRDVEALRVTKAIVVPGFVPDAS
jgi:D-arabinose 1-dehydrogenase-like Zn-dependent alcohol dehydrogenase